MMGVDPGQGAVVDPELRVHRIKNLRVVDSSVFPLITTGNTNAPTIMMPRRRRITFAKIERAAIGRHSVQCNAPAPASSPAFALPATFRPASIPKLIASRK